MLKARCPFCSEDQEVDEKLSGQAVKCEKCAKTFNAPLLFKSLKSSKASEEGMSQWKKKELIDQILFYVLAIPFLLGTAYLLNSLYQNSTGISSYNAAKKLVNQGSWEDATKAADEAIAKNSKNTDFQEIASKAYNGLGLEHKSAGRLEQAVNAFKRAIDFNSNDDMIYQNIANTQLALGKKSEALFSFKKVLAIREDDLDSQYQIGMILAETGDYKEAIKEFEYILKSDKKHYKAKYAMAVCMDQMGNSAAARTILEELLYEDPGNRDIPSRIRMIDEKNEQKRRILEEKPIFSYDILDSIGFTELKDGKKCYYYSFQFKNTTAHYFSKLTVYIYYYGFDGAKKISLGSSIVYVDNVHPSGVYPVEAWFMDERVADKIRTQEISIINE